MKIVSVIGGTANKVIFELDNKLYAIVGLNGGVQLNWYWLYLAKNMPLMASEQLDDKRIDDAKKAFEKADFSEQTVNNVLSRRVENSKMFDYQNEFIEASRERGKPLYLT